MITVRALRKSFGKIEVLRGLDLDFIRGRTTALVGPNAAGKTTLIKTMLGLASADSGDIMIDGRRVTSDPAYRAQIGYMPQIAHFPENLCGHELIEMLDDLRGGSATRDDELISALSLENELDKPLNSLSGGTRQKVNAVIAFLFDPRILILDEPTAGLDPVSSGILKAKIRDAHVAGKTILLTSHIMTEVDELAENIIFLLDGLVRFQGALHDLKTQTRQVNLERAIANVMQPAEAA